MIRVVIADDSFLFRNVFTGVIEKSGKVKVVGAAKNGQEALEIVQEVRPDLIVLDYEMPVMDGLECLKRLGQICSIPVFMLSALTHEGAEATIRALEMGAVDFFPKPKKGVRELVHIVDTLIEKFEAVVTEGRRHSKQDAAVPRPVFPAKARDIEIIAIGSSTGGVHAIKEIIPNLPKEVPPIVWAQHMPSGFTKSLAERLNALSAIHVKEAEDGERLRRGTCYLAPGGFQMSLQREGNVAMTHIYSGEEAAVHCPSCDILFSSVAECFGPKSLGIILTGMGQDGVVGLESMHGKGAFIIGQDEMSCTVYGMSKAAFQRGVVDIEMDIKGMAGWIKAAVGQKR